VEDSSILYNFFEDTERQVLEHRTLFIQKYFDEAISVAPHGFPVKVDFEQVVDFLELSVLSDVQTSLPLAVLPHDVCLVFHEDLRNFNIIVKGGDVEGGVVHSIEEVEVGVLLDQNGGALNRIEGSCHYQRCPMKLIFVVDVHLEVQEGFEDIRQVRGASCMQQGAVIIEAVLGDSLLQVMLLELLNVLKRLGLLLLFYLSSQQVQLVFYIVFRVEEGQRRI